MFRNGMRAEPGWGEAGEASVRPDPCEMHPAAVDAPAHSDKRSQLDLLNRYSQIW